MNCKKLLFPFCMVLIAAMLMGGCSKESTAKFFLNENEINYYQLKEVTDLKGLGEAMNGTKNCIIAFDAEKASIILDSLSSIGKVQGENISIELNLNGKGDYKKLADLSSIRGLTSLTVAGINENQDVSPYLDLPDLTTLVLKDQMISDYAPIGNSKTIKTLTLSGDALDYSSLPQLSIENLEIPITPQNWIALDLICKNEGITNLNQINREQFHVKNFLEGEERYYYLQYTSVAYLSKTKQEITASGGETMSSIGGSVVIAATKDLVMPSKYSEQALLNTYCGFGENQENPAIFFPMIKAYTEEDADASFVTVAGSDYMNEKFITAVTPEDAEYIFYVYALNEDGVFTTDYTSAGLQVYGQFYDVKNQKYYTPILILDTPLGAAQDMGTYQNEVLYSLNEILKSYEINTL